MSDIEIYEFSRAFANVHYSEKYQRYVSGGYSPEKVTRASQTIPEEIKRSVFNSDFALNDSYPPAPGSVSLIARDFSQYSVLAIANQQLDDGGRPTIGYRYFWLRKINTQIDGILTLLHWWMETRLQFEMEVLTSLERPKVYIHHTTDYITNIDQSWFRQLDSIAFQVQSLPWTDIVNHNLLEGLSEEYKCHYFTVCLSKRSGYNLSWAWNVRRLQQPEKFLTIFYASQEDASNLSCHYQVPIKPQEQPPIVSEPITHSQTCWDESLTNSPPSDGATSPPSSIKLPLNSSTPTPSQPFSSNLSDVRRQQPPKKAIQDCLKELARQFGTQGKLNPKNASEFCQYLINYPDANWNDFVDLTTLKLPDNTSLGLSYKALIYLVIPDHKLSLAWLSNGFLKSLDNENFGNLFLNWLEIGNILSNNLAINLHEELLKLGRSVSRAIYSRFKSSINTGISYLLYTLLNTSGSPINDWQTFYRIKCLLTHPKSSWKRCFEDYSVEIRSVILLTKEPQNQFEKYILNLVLEINNRGVISRKHGKNFLKIAALFREIKEFDLSVFFFTLGKPGSLSKRDLRSHDFVKQVFPFLQPPSFPLQPISQAVPKVIQQAILSLALLLALALALAFSTTKNLFYAIAILYWPIVIAIVIQYLLLTHEETSNQYRFQRLGFTIAIFVLSIGLFWSEWDSRKPSPLQDIAYQVFLQSDCEIAALRNRSAFLKCTHLLEQLSQESSSNQAKNALLNQVIKEYTPEPTSPYANKQAELAINYLRTSISDDNFIDQKRDLLDCQKQGGENFGKCIQEKLFVECFQNSLSSLNVYKRCLISNVAISEGLYTQLKYRLAYSLTKQGVGYLQVQYLPEEKVKTLAIYLSESQDEQDFRARQDRLSKCRLSSSFPGFTDCLDAVVNSNKQYENVNFLERFINLKF